MSTGTLTPTIDRAAAAVCAAFTGTEADLRRLLDEAPGGDTAARRLAEPQSNAPDDRAGIARCAPDRGEWVERRCWMSAEVRRYQGRITGLPHAVISDREGWSLEWHWNGSDFDGYRAECCLLQECRTGYAQWITLDGRLKYDFAKALFRKLADTARVQSLAIEPHPGVRLAWYLQEAATYQHLRGEIAAIDARLEVLWQP